MLRQLARRSFATPSSGLRQRLPHLSLLSPSRQDSVRYQFGMGLIQAKSLQHKTSGNPARIERSAFHSSSRVQGPPLIALLATVFKASTALQIAQTAGRIVLTFVPVILIKNHKSRRYLKFADVHGIPTSEEKKKMLLRRIRNRTIFFQFLLSIPVLLFWAVIVASMERTPLTGRWRLIILSPEEEDEIAAQLAGQGWYNAVGDILTQQGVPILIPPSDWRYVWVRDTLRRLEATIPILIEEREMCPEWLESNPHERPLPPPAEYPLRPRPRASEYLRYICEKMCEREKPPVPHAIPGPPYNLLLVDRPDAMNAFSYGFGPDGGGGIVVYSGFIDDILSRIPPETTIPSPPPPETSWLSSVLGALFSRAPPPPRQYVPSEKQTTDLAILLAHELAHLILSHHLETLSSATVIIPGSLSILADVVRVLIFPFTMFFGPFVNDAVAQIGKIGSGELVKVGEYCTSMKQEIEADVVSARLLAHAGFDARTAISFWEQRALTATECANAESIDSASQEDREASGTVSLVRRMAGSGHPVNEVRVDRLKSELVRWETERRATLARLRLSPEEKRSHVNLITA